MGLFCEGFRRQDTVMMEIYFLRYLSLFQLCYNVFINVFFEEAEHPIFMLSVKNIPVLPFTKQYRGLTKF